MKTARALVVCSLFAASLATRAEVGVLRHDPLTRPHDGRAYVQTIVDEPDPFGIWHRISPVSDVRRVALNTDGDTRGDGKPTVVYHAGWERSIVVWARNLNPGMKIVASQFVDADWAAPRRINTQDGEQLDPALTIGPDGTLHVVYWQISGEAFEVYHQSLGALGDAWTTPVRVSTAGVVSCRPSVVVHDGTLYVAYEVHPNGADQLPKEITLAEWSTDGFTSQVVASSSHDAAMWPQVHSRSGKLWVDWIDFTSGPFDGDMAWTRLQDSGTWTAIEFETFTSEEELEYFVRGTISNQAAPHQAYQQTPPTQTP